MQSDYLQHHGILGQKWGVRRFQNKDGSLTEAGKKKLYGKAGTTYAGYESYRSRIKRSMDAAKYEKDIAKNQKKLDKATSKGNVTKIQKYSQIDKILKTNRDHMVKDLSPEMIKLGKDYIEINKATTIGTIIAGPLGGIGAGTAKMVSTKVRDTEKAVKEQENERKRLYEDVKAANKEINDYTHKIINEPYEGKVKKEHERFLDKQIKAQDAYENYNKSQQDRNTQSFEPYVKPGTTEFKSLDAAAKYAKKTGNYNMEFIERNLDYDKNGEPLTGKELDAAYRKFLKEEW